MQGADLLRKFMGYQSLSEVPLTLRVPFITVMFINRSLLFPYPLALFMLLRWSDCYRVSSLLQCIYETWSNNFHSVGQLVFTQSCTCRVIGQPGTQRDRLSCAACMWVDILLVPSSIMIYHYWICLSLHSL